MTAQFIAAGILGFVLGFIFCLALVYVVKHYAEMDNENPNKNQ
jgi:tetrahydromethanopterin S-methyltransferase subunit F